MRRQRPQLLISDSKGRICNVPHLAATGMKGGCFFRLSAKDLIKLPSESELFMLPDRLPVGYDPQLRRFAVLDRTPFSNKKEKCFAVAAFISPGFTVSYSSSYKQMSKAKLLPLFSYAACAFYKGGFYATSVRVDRELRQNLRLMDINLVKKNVVGLKKLFPGNRLIRHLANCALGYGCPAAKNFFLSRYEAPLPTSPFCNARCVGCISHQPQGRCSVTQERITFVPSPEEVAEVACFHIDNVQDPVVSFGQGCEGEPLLIGGVLEDSIKLIRKRTTKGIINLNTNASKPKLLAKLFDAGLDSIRVSLNSIRETYYRRYYLPRGYRFGDVLRSIKVAKQKRGFVSINYLIMPGFTDAKEEFTAMNNFIATYRVDMIQWRNLNFDPLAYFRKLRVSVDNAQLLGIREIISALKKAFPRLLMGYFNPSRLRMKRHQASKR